MNSRRQKNISKKDKKKAIGIVLIIAVLMTVTAFGLRIWENNSYAVDNSGYEANINKPEVHEIEDNGDMYRRRDDIESYLFIGVDQEGTAQSNGSYIEGGQGDVQMLLVLDDKNRTWQVLQLNRDTITDVPVLGVFGDVVSSERQQLALAHSYGDGTERSCENNVNTVSALLYDQPIDGYAALNMDAVKVLTDTVGGVTITPQADFDDNGLVLKAGESAFLDGKDALTYVRARMSVDDGTNPARMARQRIYLSALKEKLINSDSDMADRLYKALTEYMITDLTDKKVSVIANKLRLYDEKELLTIDGESYIEDEHWAYYLDEESFKDTVLQLFYEKE